MLTNTIFVSVSSIIKQLKFLNASRKPKPDIKIITKTIKINLTRQKALKYASNQQEYIS